MCVALGGCARLMSIDLAQLSFQRARLEWVEGRGGALRRPRDWVPAPMAAGKYGGARPRYSRLSEARDTTNTVRFVSSFAVASNLHRKATSTTYGIACQRFYSKPCERGAYVCDHWTCYPPVSFSIRRERIRWCPLVRLVRVVPIAHVNIQGFGVPHDLLE